MMYDTNFRNVAGLISTKINTNLGILYKKWNKWKKNCYHKSANITSYQKSAQILWRIEILRRLNFSVTPLIYESFV